MKRRAKQRGLEKRARTPIGVALFEAALFWVLFFAAAAHGEGLVIMAKKISGPISTDPGSKAWGNASPVEVLLGSQVMVMPRVNEPKVKTLKARALHNTREIAFLVEWEDPTEDTSVDLDVFPDAVALEFPSSAAAEKPHFAMGDKDSTVNIWYWRSTWEKPPKEEQTYAQVDNFLGGVAANNPVSAPRRTPVENMIARGYGTATSMEKIELQRIEGRGTRRANRWEVIFKRPLKAEDKLEADFAEGKVIPVAFAVWDGSGRERGGLKTVSTWYYVGLETEQRKGAYIYPIVGLIGAAGLEVGILFWVRKRRRHESIGPQ